MLDSTLSNCEAGDDSPLTTLNIDFDDVADAATLPCEDREYFKLGPKYNSVSAGGRLMTSKYGQDANITQFCVSATRTGDVIAVTCDLCRVSKVR